MKKYVLPAVLLAMLPLLVGSVSKGPARTLLPIADDLLASAESARIAQTGPTETKDYSFRYIFDSSVDSDAKFKDKAADFIAPDVNIFTHLVGIAPPKLDKNRIKAQVVVVPGFEVLAQALFDAIENRKNAVWETPRVGTPNVVGRSGGPSFRYSPLWRYYIYMGRTTLHKAYGILPVNNGEESPLNPGGIYTICDPLATVIGANGQEQRECDAYALLQVRKCIRLRVTGERIKPRDYPNW